MELKYEITEELGVLSENEKGWRKELNLVSWNERDAKYDIRDWNPSHERMSKGVTLTKEEMEFSYRHSIIQEHPKWIVLEATFELENKSVEEINEKLDKRKERRMSSQPWNKPSAGSVFRNPEGSAAWKLIDDAGLRGYEIGGAQVSPKHSNFIVNNGYASAKDIYDLIFYVQKTVQEQSGVLLKPEVRFINWEL